MVRVFVNVALSELFVLLNTSGRRKPAAYLWTPQPNWLPSPNLCYRRFPAKHPCDCGVGGPAGAEKDESDESDLPRQGTERGFYGLGCFHVIWGTC